jgi:hypothetical protein
MAFLALCSPRTWSVAAKASSGVTKRTWPLSSSPRTSADSAVPKVMTPRPALSPFQ